jgi:hypothetical protein
MYPLFCQDLGEPENGCFAFHTYDIIDCSTVSNTVAKLGKLIELGSEGPFADEARFEKRLYLFAHNDILNLA